MYSRKKSVFRFNMLLWTLLGNTTLSEQSYCVKALNTSAICPVWCGTMAVPCDRVGEQPAHTYPCWDHWDDIKGFACCASGLILMGVSTFQRQTFDGFLKITFCSVLEPWGRFLSLIQGSLISSLGIRGGLLEASCWLVFQTSAYHTRSSGHAFCTHRTDLTGVLKTKNNVNIFGTAYISLLLSQCIGLHDKHFHTEIIYLVVVRACQ